MMIRYAVCAFFFLALAILTVDVADCHDLFPSVARRFLEGPGPSSSPNDGSLGTRWALLVAGSNGYNNYRHQADVCHAYQVLKRGGLKDENIIVFMYDDIANAPENPRAGVIINRPHGEDVYKGVPKDYVGDQVTVNNFYAAILGNKSAVTGGSRKVLESGPNDYIFIFYVDHGAPGVIGLPDSRRPYVYANDLIDVLKKKHASGTYKSLLFYLEACEGGSMFEGLLPQGLNIYATTASNATENSYATYCDFEEYICFGDMYSVAWMEDSETNNLEKETLGDQYQRVKNRTKIGTKNPGSDQYSSSNVMQYGDIKLSEETLSSYMGSNTGPRRNYTFAPVEHRPDPTSIVVDQRDADLFQLSLKINKAPKGSAQESEAQKQLEEALAHRTHVDISVQRIGELLFGLSKGPQVMSSLRPAGQQVVDDWDCLKSMVSRFETYCGSLSKYGMKHVRSFANICNAGVKAEKMSEASAQACSN